MRDHWVGLGLDPCEAEHLATIPLGALSQIPTWLRTFLDYRGTHFLDFSPFAVGTAPVISPAGDPHHGQVRYEYDFGWIPIENQESVTEVVDLVELKDAIEQVCIQASRIIKNSEFPGILSSQRWELVEVRFHELSNHPFWEQPKPI